MVASGLEISGGNEKLPPDDSTKNHSKFRYNSPLVQVGLIGLVCFCCPGMYLALTGMGGGGQIDPTASNNANTALYTMFAIFGILGGGIYNILGPQLTLFAGCSTYVLYAGSFLYYNHFHHQAFVIIAGGILGVGAGLLWAAQGAIMTSYPPPDRKGTYISIFWSIFNLGGVIGGLIPFILNFSNPAGSGSVNDGTYIGFMVFMSIGAVLSLAILHPSRVIRDDGSTCTNIQYSDLSTECSEILKLFLNWKMLLIFPAAWASNFFYTYQFNNVNGVVFDLRTRGLTNMFYWAAQMIGSILIGYLMDHTFKNRKARGLFGLTVVVAVGTATWGGGLAHQLGYSRDHEPKHKLDFKDGTDFAGPFVLYFCYGLLDAMFQSMVYWIIGALANDSEILSRTRGLTNMFYWAAQMIGSILIGYLMDHTFKNRKARGLFGLTVVVAVGTATWGGGLAHQLGYSRDHEPKHKLDFKDGTDFAGPFVLYFCYGLLDAMFQSMVYWIIGALANDSEILSRYAGFYKGVQSAGAAVAWQLDTRKVSFLIQLIINWGLMTISFPLLFLLIILEVKDDNQGAEAASGFKEVGVKSM